MAVRNTASRMGAASAASTRAAPKQSLELPAVCTAGFVSSASSPTISRMMHRNSAARPRRPKPRMGSSSCETSTGGGEWSVRRGSPQLVMFIC
jgi:hypothetical protein